jgi:hypothetical protein
MHPITPAQRAYLEHLGEQAHREFSSSSWNDLIQILAARWRQFKLDNDPAWEDVSSIAHTAWLAKTFPGEVRKP